jgi:hypothetical protein
MVSRFRKHNALTRCKARAGDEGARHTDSVGATTSCIRIDTCQTVDIRAYPYPMRTVRATPITVDVK